MQREELREVAPLRVVARKQDDLVAEDVGVVLQVGVHLALDVGPLGVELVVLGSLRRTRWLVFDPSLVVGTTTSLRNRADSLLC